MARCRVARAHSPHEAELVGRQNEGIAAVANVFDQQDQEQGRAHVIELEHLLDLHHGRLNEVIRRPRRPIVRRCAIACGLRGFQLLQPGQLLGGALDELAADELVALSFPARSHGLGFWQRADLPQRVHHDLSAAIANERNSLMALLEELVAQLDERALQRLDDHLRPLHVQIAELKLSNAELRITNAKLRETLIGNSAGSSVAGMMSALN